MVDGRSGGHYLQRQVPRSCLAGLYICSAHFSSYWMDVHFDKCRVCSCRSVKHVSSYRGHVVGMPCDYEAARHDPCLVIARVSRLLRPPPSSLPRLLDGGGWQQGASSSSGIAAQRVTDWHAMCHARRPACALVRLALGVTVGGAAHGWLLPRRDL